MNIFIALGSNLGDREANFSKALGQIEEGIGEICRKSQWYETEALLDPAGFQESQPNYLNGVIALETDKSLESVLGKLQMIESELGRIRDSKQGKWAARTIDLDIIGAGEIVLDAPSLRVPHPEMHKRRFVLEPLAEIAPEWRHPILRKTAQELLLEIAK